MGMKTKCAAMLAVMFIGGCSTSSSVIEPEYTGPTSRIAVNMHAGTVKFKNGEACSNEKWKLLSTGFFAVNFAKLITVPAGQEVSFHHKWSEGTAMVSSNCDVVGTFTPEPGKDYLYSPQISGGYCVIEMSEVSLRNEEDTSKAFTVVQDFVDTELTSRKTIPLQNCDA